MKYLLESKYAFILVSILLAISPLLFAQNKKMGVTELEVQKLLQDAAFQQGEVAFLAINLDNGRVIAEHNSQKLMIPASIQKLYTTGVALETFGSEHRFKTNFSHTGSIVDGTLNGNLIITAGGDPALGSHYLGLNSDQLLSFIKTQLWAKGVKSVNGKVIIDTRIFNAHNTPRGMLWEDMGNYFGASPTALMWQDNMLKINLASGQAGTPALLAGTLPKSFHKTLELDIFSSKENRDNAWFFSAPGSDVIYGKGTIPEKQTKFSVKISDPNPMERFGEELVNYLGWNNEVQVSQLNVEYNDKPLFTLESEKLIDLITKTNMQSINLFADALATQLDPASSSKSVEGGVIAIENRLNSMKVTTKGLRLLDGSGISPMNRITAQSMVDFLGAMYRSQNFNAFFSSLPVAGESGTIKGYFSGTKAQGNLRAKSGTMVGVRNYAGYVTNKYQENIAFCLIMNDFDESRKSIVMERVQLLLNALIED